MMRRVLPAAGQEYVDSTGWPRLAVGPSGGQGGWPGDVPYAQRPMARRALAADPDGPLRHRLRAHHRRFRASARCPLLRACQRDHRPVPRHRLPVSREPARQSSGHRHRERRPRTSLRWHWAGPAVPPLTRAQVEANARILAGHTRRTASPCSSAPTPAPGSRGLAYHRQGIDGNFSACASPAACRRGDLDRHFGKVCPGDARIAQLPQILARSRRRHVRARRPQDAPRAASTGDRLPGTGAADPRPRRRGHAPSSTACLTRSATTRRASSCASCARRSPLSAARRSRPERPAHRTTRGPVRS